MYYSYNLELLHILDNNEKYYICNICSNNNDESIEVVISVSVSKSVLFIANISVIGTLINLLIGAPLIVRHAITSEALENT